MGIAALRSPMTPENSRCHGPQRLHDRIQPIGQRRRSRLQDDRRLDLDDAVVAHRRDIAPARTLPDAIRHDLLAAPGREDHVGRGFAHHIGRNDPVLGRLLKPQLWQRVLAAGDLDQFGHPADAGDQRIVPFLEIDFWFRRGPGRRRDTREALFKVARELIGALGRADDGAERADHREDAGDVALVEDVNGDARAHQIGDDVGLQVGEGEHEIGLERREFSECPRR